MSELDKLVEGIQAKQNELATAIETKAGADIIENLKQEVKDIAAKSLETVKELEEKSLAQGEEISKLNNLQVVNLKNSPNVKIPDDIENKKGLHIFR